MLKDLTGQRFGKLIVLKQDLEKKSKNKYWVCQCDCGKIKSIQGSHLISGATQSCGCLHKEKISNNLVNQKFGKLTVIKDSGKRTKNRGIIWECKCDCGKITEVTTNNLKQKITFSCGCLKQSKGEFIIENLLKEHKIKYRKEYTFKDLISPRGGILRFDFAIFNEQGELIKLIEFDGETHFFEFVSGGWETFEKVQYQQECDKMKDEYCKKHNIPLQRIKYYQKDNIKIEDLLNGVWI